jgi:hypothetical protein
MSASSTPKNSKIEVVPMTGRKILLGVLSLFLLLGVAVGIGGNYGRTEVSNQLSEQRITFPVDAAHGLLPGVSQYAGQKLTTGFQAKAYADGFIAVHVAKATGNRTYSEVSAAAMAAPKGSQAATDLAGLKQTAFQGEALRGMLLNAWGWYLLATIAFYAGIVVAVAALLALVALALRRRTV